MRHKAEAWTKGGTTPQHDLPEAGRHHPGEPTPGNSQRGSAHRRTTATHTNHMRHQNTTILECAAGARPPPSHMRRMGTQLPCKPAGDYKSRLQISTDKPQTPDILGTTLARQLGHGTSPNNQPCRTWSPRTDANNNATNRAAKGKRHNTRIGNTDAPTTESLTLDGAQGLAMNTTRMCPRQVDTEGSQATTNLPETLMHNPLQRTAAALLPVRGMCSCGGNAPAGTIWKPCDM